MNQERKIRRLEKRVEKLESIVNDELGYDIGNNRVETSTVDCVCGNTFEVNIQNGLICPECGRGSEERGDYNAEA